MADCRFHHRRMDFKGDGQMKPLHPLKSPITGKPIPWVCAAATDIKEHSFKRAEVAIPAKNVRELKKVVK